MHQWVAPQVGHKAAIPDHLHRAQAPPAALRALTQRPALLLTPGGVTVGVQGLGVACLDVVAALDAVLVGAGLGGGQGVWETWGSEGWFKRLVLWVFVLLHSAECGRTTSRDCGC